MLSPPLARLPPSLFQPWSQQHQGLPPRAAMVLQGQDVGHPSRAARANRLSNLLHAGNTRWHTTTAVLLLFLVWKPEICFKASAWNVAKSTEQNMSLSTLLKPTVQITFPIKFHPSCSVRVIFLFRALPNLAALESKQILYLVAC